jgi:hypothetical protein
VHVVSLGALHRFQPICSAQLDVEALWIEAIEAISGLKTYVPHQREMLDGSQYDELVKA